MSRATWKATPTTFLMKLQAVLNQRLATNTVCGTQTSGICQCNMQTETHFYQQKKKTCEGILLDTENVEKTFFSPSFSLSGSSLCFCRSPF